MHFLRVIKKKKTPTQAKKVNLATYALKNIAVLCTLNKINTLNLKLDSKSILISKEFSWAHFNIKCI